MTDDERRGVSELTALRNGPVEVTRYHNRVHVEILCPLGEGQVESLFKAIAAIVKGARHD